MKQSEKALKATRSGMPAENTEATPVYSLSQNYLAELTELKQAYQNLQQREERLRLAAESSNIGIWDWDLATKEIKWSGQMEKLFGLEPRTAPESLEAFIELIHPDDQQNIEAVLKTAFETGEFGDCEYRVKLPNGKLNYLLCKGQFVKNNGDKPERLLGTVLNITDRKEAEIALHFLAEASEVLASSLDYQTTLQNLAQLTVPKLTNWCTVHIVDSSGTPKQVAIAHVDPSKIEWALQIQAELESSYPYNPEAPSGIPKVMRTGLPELYPEIKDEALVAAAGDDSRLLEILRQIQYTSLMIVPLIARGRVIGAIQFAATQESNYHYNEQDLNLALEIARRAAIAVDNARLYQDSQQALAAQQELDQLRDRFLSIASHELRTPLTAIKGFSQMLHLGVKKRQKLVDAEETAEFNLETLASWLARDGKMLESIQHQVNRMNELIGEMLDISRIQSGHLRLEFTPNLNIFEIIQRVIDQQQTVSPYHTISLETPPEIANLEQWRREGLWDERRIEQVLSNLLNNAVKYSQQQTAIRVGLEYRPQQLKKLKPRNYTQLENSKSEPYSSAQDEYIIISVKDEGYGISVEDQANIFQRFYRAGSEAGRNLDGLGLGLYISNQIVLQHGGQMWVESKPGKGSTFYFSLPLKSAKNE